MASLDFVEGTTVSIAGTLGDGAVTMSRLSGASVDLAALLLPGDFWPGTGSMDCSYVIEDIRTSSTAIKIETGIGVITNNVLTRTKPRMTVSGDNRAGKRTGCYSIRGRADGGECAYSHRAAV